MADDAGLSPLDVATGVAIPEFDGRVIGPSFAFKEVVDADGTGQEVVATRADPERTARLAALAVRTAHLAYVPAEERRVAIVLSAYPTKRSRLGNAVGLDTPASAVELLGAMRAAGYRLTRVPIDGDALMDELVAGFTYEHARLSANEVACAAGSLAVDSYTTWFESLPADARAGVETMWGPAPGEVYVDSGALHFPGIDLDHVLVTIQPPRGFGADPIRTYHAPDMPPPHHYLAFYRWLATPVAAGGWGADAIVHLGKHGTLEWLPGKALALSASCYPDAALADVPLFYPFVVNDPGEGTQAKRRAHAVVVDHLPPPLTRADTYDDLARLEQLLDTYASVSAMDPAKAPAFRDQVWDLLVNAEIHRDLDLGDAPPPVDAFDEVVLHVDGYLCALKDAQIRGGLHVLGQVPDGETLIDTVLAVTRLPQGAIPSLRATVAAELGVALDETSRHGIDRVEDECRCPRSRAREARLAPGSKRRLDIALGGRAARSQPSANAPGDRQPARRSRRPPRARGRERGAESWRRPRLADWSQLLFRGPESNPVEAGVGGRRRIGRPARRAPSGRDGRPPDDGRARAVGNRRDADDRRRRRRSARPPGRSAGVEPRKPAGDRHRAHPAHRAPPPEGRRDLADQRLLPRCLPPRDRAARRRGATGGRRGRTRGGQPDPGRGR